MFIWRMADPFGVINSLYLFNMTLFREDPGNWPTMWKLQVGLFWGVVEDWWNWIHVAWITIVYSAEGVPGALSCERSLIRACEKGPVAWGGVRELTPDIFGVSLGHRQGIPIGAFSKEAIGGVNNVSGNFWPRIGWWLWDKKLMTAMPAMSWFIRFLHFHWIVLWRIINWLLHSFHSMFHRRTGTRPTKNSTVLKPKENIYTGMHQ